MPKKPNLKKLAAKATIKDQYKKQINRVKARGEQTDCIDGAVKDAVKKLPTASSGSLVIYGDPQSGKTEMMICLTARILDDGQKVIVHLLNDSVDLLGQNLDRFKLAGLAPAPRNSTELADSPLAKGSKAILFCKKNAKDLEKLIPELAGAGPLVVIDDEADFATPNAKINKKEKTRINKLVQELLGADGKYIGVTATPARLNLNNTFNNKTETWVHFRAHDAYTGPDDFFPLTGPVPYRLERLNSTGSAADAQKALARFFVTVAYLNTTATNKGEPEQNYTFLVHTSGKKDDHKIDRKNIEAPMNALAAGAGSKFEALLETIYEQAEELYPSADPGELLTYVVENATRSSVTVLNSTRIRTAGAAPAIPTCPFNVIIGGNIVSRGVTFPNLLAMYFTRDVANKLQQDTYIQRARMFGARGRYLKHFELTIPRQLYKDWHRCFVFHRLALSAIKNNNESPVWVGDPRISIASSSSIDRQTVNFDQGEMSFLKFPFASAQKFDDILAEDPKSISTLKKLAQAVGKKAFPPYLLKYLDAVLKTDPGTLAIHEAGTVENYTPGPDFDLDAISRKKGFIGTTQLEKNVFPKAVHHIKIFHNGKGWARVFYKNQRRVQFVKNTKK